MADVGYCKDAFVGMDATHLKVRLTAPELAAECQGLGVELLKEEWRIAGRLSQVYAIAHNEYRNNPTATPPYGFDQEESDRLNAELRKKLKE